MDEFRKEADDFFCRFTFGQFVTLILLEVVTLFFVFYLGAHYGPDLLTGGQKKEAVLPPEGPKNVGEIVGEAPVDYSYPEILTHRKGQEGAIRVKPSGVTAKEYEREPPIREMEAAQEKSSQGPVSEEQPVTQEDSRIPSGKYAVQVGSYQSAEEASSMVKRWKGKGYSAFMSVGQIPQKGTWYRVRIGGFLTREKAEAFLEQFKKRERVGGLVVLSRS